MRPAFKRLVSDFFLNSFLKYQNSLTSPLYIFKRVSINRFNQILRKGEKETFMKKLSLKKDHLIKE